MWRGGGQTSGRQEAGRNWELLAGLVEELMKVARPGLQEEQASGYYEEGMTGDQVIRIFGWGRGGGRERFWLLGERQDLRPGSKAG